MKKSLSRRSAKGAARVAAASSSGILRRISKGKRPQFYENLAVDQLFAVVTALTAEVAVAFDRIDTLERVLTQSGHLGSGAMEGFQADVAATELRALRREELIQRVFSVFESYAATQEH